MESGDSMPHSPGLSNNPYPEPKAGYNPVTRSCLIFMNRHIFQQCEVVSLTPNPQGGEEGSP